MMQLRQGNDIGSHGQVLLVGSHIDAVLIDIRAYLPSGRVYGLKEIALQNVANRLQQYAVQSLAVKPYPDRASCNRTQRCMIKRT